MLSRRILFGGLPLTRSCKKYAVLGMMIICSLPLKRSCNKYAHFGVRFVWPLTRSCKKYAFSARTLERVAIDAVLQKICSRRRKSCLVVAIDAVSQKVCSLRRKIFFAIDTVLQKVCFLGAYSSAGFTFSFLMTLERLAEILFV